MASTTLVTFLFDCPSAVRSVELLGSWDNFSKPYHLKQDRRRGPGIWSGCYTFADIICDGDVANIGGTRSGALKMGGTYWYYYKVDDDDERHNSSEQSTTLCPLLPGQRLNVLEVPTETRSRSGSESSHVFTRNPRDKYQTPVPPKPLPSPRLGDLCIESYVPMYSSLQGGPRSATHPPKDQSMSHGFERHARSASSTSPQHSRGAVFTEFKGLKDRLVASKRSPSTSPRQPTGVRELQIGAPTLVSTTAEEVNLVPLSRTSASLRVPRTSSSLPPPVTANKMRGFSPLGSHPVSPPQQFDFGFSDATLSQGERSSRRSRSRASSTIATTEFKLGHSRARANSADTRRTRHYLSPNEPWVSTPKPRQSFDREIGPAPVLQRPSTLLEPPSTDDRPSSSHGGDRSPSLRRSPLDKDKDLPPLPRYLVPAPLFACNSTAPSPIITQGEEAQAPVPEPEKEKAVEIKEAEIRLVIERRGHFSTWSSESSTSSCPTTDDDAIHSPTFSSLTSDSSDMGGSPQRMLDPFTHGDQTYTLTDKDLEDSDFPSTLSSSPPQLQLNPLHISTFGPSLLQLDVHLEGSAPRRQAACFGLGFQGYSLPEDETESQATITKVVTPSEPAITNGRESSVSHLQKLMNEFGYLGDAVL
ncbi:hypothetical protein K505DRAFT_334550 [Melanomma pulvis-pyrius CBS 109.77]|uniref:Uncharacterized protein n=1 Tax=Melanomma pulvis-pyrius CBS 109.77 TaxID=1314802 RepID=A0A6A6XLQ0_9PLEO|nr:hypothetical protein K505DRAFT_334550 [Melanomma pulvis-pyrius CBS 109.77]